MLAEFLKVIIASIVLNAAGSGLPIVSLPIALSAYLTSGLCLFSLFFFLSGRSTKPSPSPHMMNLAFIAALSVALVFDQFYSLPFQLSSLIGVSGRDWGIPAIIDLVLFIVLWCAALLPNFLVN